MFEVATHAHENLGGCFHDMMPDFMHMPGGGNYGILWWVLLAVFWILAFVTIILIIRWLWLKTERKKREDSGEKPLEILKKRYAQGEITKDEFDSKKKDITERENLDESS